MNYYYADASNQPIGPVSDDHLRSLCQNGTITLDTLVVPEGGSDWQAYRSVPTPGKPPVPVPPMTPQSMPQAPATKKCPFCAELISTEAKKCKHCGETLDVALRAAEEAKRTYANQQMVQQQPATQRQKVVIDKGGAWCPHCGCRNSVKKTSGAGCAFVIFCIFSMGLGLLMIPFLPKTWHCRECGHTWK